MREWIKRAETCASLSIALCKLLQSLNSVRIEWKTGI